MPTRIPFIAVVGCALVGIGSAYHLARMVGHERAFEAEAQRVGAEVVAFKEREDARHGVTYAPVFRFTTTDGTTLDRPSRNASRPPAWSIGEHALVLYDPREPTTVVTDTWLGRWGGAALLAVVSLSFFAAAALAARARLIGRRPS